MNDAAAISQWTPPINRFEENLLIDETMNYLIDLSIIFSFGLLEESRWDISSRGNFLTQAEKLLCHSHLDHVPFINGWWYTLLYFDLRSNGLINIFQYLSSSSQWLLRMITLLRFAKIIKMTEAVEMDVDAVKEKIPRILDWTFFTITKVDGGKVMAKCCNCMNNSICWKRATNYNIWNETFIVLLSRYSD